MRNYRPRYFALAILIASIGFIVSAYAETGGALSPPPPSPGTSLRMITWNIQMLPTLFDRFSEALQKMQHIRVPWIVEFLKQQPYDLVCLQEVLDAKSQKEIVEGLRDAYPYAVLPQYAPQGNFFSNGVLFLSKIPIHYVAHIAYEKAVDVDALASKGCCLIEGLKDQIAFQVAGTHLQAGPQQIRDEQYVEMAEKLLKPYRRAGVPQFIMGDFNTAKGSPEYQALLQCAQVQDFPVDDPQPFSVDNTNSWKDASEQGELIDHVLLNPGGSSTTIVHQTIQRARTSYQGKTIDLADHYGVVAEAVLAR